MGFENWNGVFHNNRSTIESSLETMQFYGQDATRESQIHINYNFN